MENTPITQEIFSAFMKCLNQYDFANPLNLKEADEPEVEVDENKQITTNYFADMEQLRLV